MRNRLQHILSSLIITGLLLAACGPAAPAPEALQATIQAAATATLGAQLEATVAAQVAAANQAETQAAAAEQTTATAAASITPSVTPPPTLVGVGAGNAPQLTLTTRNAINCRSGPSTGLPVAVVLPAETNYPVLGRNEQNNWVQVEVSGSPACWIAITGNVTIDGDLTRLALAPTPAIPTRTPGPTEAPGFRAARPNLVDCEGRNFIAVLIQPTGGLTLNSGSITVTLQADGSVAGYRDSNNLFGASQNSCGGGNPSVGPGQQAWITVLVKAADNAAMRVLLELCTENGQSGECFKTTVNYNP